MFTEFFIVLGLVALVTTIFTVIAWWLVPLRRHWAAAALEILGISFGAAARELVFGWFPSLSMKPARYVVTAVLLSGIWLPVLYWAKTLRQNRKVHA